MAIITNYEDDLISPKKWRKLFKQMPKECQELVIQMEKEPDCMGIGRNDKMGWFISGSGQGPAVYWKEK